ncbi:hypothetical protein MMPV_007186 [Pyropia vietnamensis]
MARGIHCYESGGNLFHVEAVSQLRSMCDEEVQKAVANADSSAKDVGADGTVGGGDRGVEFQGSGWVDGGWTWRKS